MQRQTPVTSSWNLDSDEIASVTSEDLHENRPNRWIGAKSSWRHLTAEERQLWRSMQQLQGQDLAVHLYDAFALRSCRDPETLRGLTVRTDTGDEVVWAPPKIWTAWPLREHKVPQQSLIPRQNDEDDGFTYRKPEARLPRSELQEELGATILRLAKQRFSKRRWAADEASSDAERVGQADPLTQSSDMSGHEAPDLDSDRMQVDHATDRSCQDEGSSQRAKRRKRESSRTFRPVVSADDDRSYKLLDPCVGHILSRVDRILTILHNARVAGVSHLSDSSTGSDSDSQSSRKRRRGRGRLRRTSLPRERDTSNSVSSPGGGGDGGGGAAGPRRRGRPRKVHIPRDGETLEEMQIRVAREGHRRLPVTQKDRDRAFEEWLRKSDDSKSAHAEEMKQLVVAPEEVASNKESEDGYSTAATTRSHTNIDKKLRRWGLRDWSDVVGAAALAGFPEDVVRRTTRRCARLFGEGMVIRRLEETPLTRGRDLAVVDFEYRPERIAPFTSTSPGAAGPTGARAPGDYYDDLSHDDDDDDSPAPTLQQRRLASLASTPSPRGRRSRSRSVGAATATGPSRSRSRSRCSSMGELFFCPVTACDRAAKGFSRRPNLRRHMTLVHPGRAPDDADSDDEVFGAVHVDGFLRPIAAGRGWRAQDAAPRVARGSRRGEQRRQRRGRESRRGSEAERNEDDVAYGQDDHDAGSYGGDEAD